MDVEKANDNQNVSGSVMDIYNTSLRSVQNAVRFGIHSGDEKGNAHLGNKNDFVYDDRLGKWIDRTARKKMHCKRRKVILSAPLSDDLLMSPSTDSNEEQVM